MEDLEIHFTDPEAEEVLLKEVRRRQKKYWINKYGERIDIETMDDSYLLNCLNLVRRENGEKFDRLYGEVIAETMDYGDR